MVSVQVGDERLIADAKVFGPETGKGYIGQGFRQVYQYTCDYNQAIGYLVIFNTSEKQLNFLLPATAGGTLTLTPASGETDANGEFVFLHLDAGGVLHKRGVAGKWQLCLDTGREYHEEPAFHP